MFQALIVDDEILSVKAIRRMVEWQSLGVAQIFEASNGYEAQKILQENTIHLMICDIEMPQMDGLTLVEWIREEHLHTEVIMLTCHASFDMAQKALRLGSVEYILKPVAGSALTESARRALEVWKEKDNYRAISRRWDKSIALRRVQYFNDIIRKNIPSTSQALENYARKYAVPYNEEENIHMILVCIEDIYATPKDVQAVLFGLRNVAQELWSEALSGWDCLVRCSDNDFLLLGSEPVKVDFEESLCKCLEQFSQEYLELSVRAYTAQSCQVRELCSRIDYINKIHERKQFLELPASGAQRPEKETVWRSAENRWRGYVENHTPRLIQEELNLAIKNLSGTTIQRTIYLQKLRHNLLSAIKMGLHSNAALFTNLLEQEESRLQDNYSPYMEAQFLAWSDWLLQKLERWQQGNDRSSDVVDQIRKYITLNIHRDITREEIATAVYLNPDYVARLFKKETGMTLNSYIVKKRITLAKHLLSSTQISVGDISSSLGYSSFSHFTKLFKSSEGVTPSEYRRLHRTGD